MNLYIKALVSMPARCSPATSEGLVGRCGLPLDAKCNAKDYAAWRWLANWEIKVD